MHFEEEMSFLDVPERKVREGSEENCGSPIAGVLPHYYRRLINIRRVGQVSRCPWRRASAADWTTYNETVKRAVGLILIEGYAAGNNRQLAERRATMRLGFADNGLRGRSHERGAAAGASG